MQKATAFGFIAVPTTSSALKNGMPSVTNELPNVVGVVPLLTTVLTSSRVVHFTSATPPRRRSLRPSSPPASTIEKACHSARHSRFHLVPLVDSDSRRDR